MVGAFAYSGCADKDYKENVKKFDEATKEADDVDENIFEYMSFYNTEFNGDFTIYKRDGITTFNYNNGDNVAMSLNWDSSKVKNNIVLDFTLRYEGVDGEYAVFYDDESDCNSSELEDIIWGLDGSESIWSFSGTPASKVDIAKDSKLIYARTITMLEMTLDELGFSFDDFGFDFGSKYKDIDVSSRLCDEYVPEYIAHDFKNGVCKDCNKDWIDCASEAIGIYNGDGLRVQPSNDVEDKIGGCVSFDSDKNGVEMRWWRTPSANNPDATRAEMYLKFYTSSPNEVYFSFSYGGEWVAIEGDPYTGTIEGDTTLQGTMSIDDFNEFIKTHEAPEDAIVIFVDHECVDEASDEVWEAFDELVPSVLDCYEIDLNAMGMSFDDVGIDS